jgi:predicted AlkP superfamily phosphohydrolase/phosphomutase
MNSLLIFELDGGSWAVIEPLLEEGRLPHIAGLIQRGARGVLHSVPPLVSPALWTTIYTGQPRERHGVLAFDATSQEVCYSRLWDIAHAHGMVCGVCGSLVTWPPYNVGGFMIPDIMARDARTIPPQFAHLQELALKYPRGREGANHNPILYARYAVALSRMGIRGQTMLNLAREVLISALLRRSYRDTYWRRALLLQQLYTDAFLRLYRTYHPGLATYHYHVVDTLSHRYWKAYESKEEDSSYHEVIPAAYRAADRALGSLLKVAGPDTTVVLLSDHGFHTAPEERSWYTARLARWIEILGLEGIVTPTRLGLQHFLYFRDTSRLVEISNALRSATFKETGIPALRRVVTRDESLFFLPPRVRGEGLTVIIPGYAELAFEELFKDTSHLESGTHDPEGIVVLAGPPVRQGVDMEKASILDVTPTLLALLGLPIAGDFEGRIWTEVIRPEFLERSPPVFVDTYRREMASGEGAELSDADRELLYRRLSDLGYM